jgi:hypothetical protein
MKKNEKFGWICQLFSLFFRRLPEDPHRGSPDVTISAGTSLLGHTVYKNYLTKSHVHENSIPEVILTHCFLLVVFAIGMPFCG